MNCIKRRKANLISIFGGKCCICGFNDFQEALEFHHVNPEEKEFGLSASSATTKSLEKQIAEVKKCILVCANCHRGIEYNRLSVPDNWRSFFNEDIAQQLLDENYRIKHKEKHYCQRCGQEVWSGSTYCTDCKNFLSRTIERPSRDELKALIREKPFTAIATIYGVTDNAIRKWCDAENLPRKKSDIKALSDEEWENI